ncbi:MAG: hypothetical protein IT290_08010 [Deltaproteobacteria bacterium]|nr:hypothetical protein [Deltaproteobacteria bacterium]
MPLYGAFFPGSPEALSKAGGLLEGTYFADLRSMDSALLESAKGDYEEFNRRYGGTKSLPVMYAVAMEQMRALDLASRSDDPRKALHAADFHGVTGPWRFDANGDIVGPTHVMKVIRGGKPVEAERPESP